MGGCGRGRSFARRVALKANHAPGASGVRRSMGRLIGTAATAGGRCHGEGAVGLGSCGVLVDVGMVDGGGGDDAMSDLTLEGLRARAQAFRAEFQEWTVKVGGTPWNALEVRLLAVFTALVAEAGVDMLHEFNQ